jgi:hypothetical protein
VPTYLRAQTVSRMKAEAQRTMTSVEVASDDGEEDIPFDEFARRVAGWGKSIPAEFRASATVSIYSQNDDKSSHEACVTVCHCQLLAADDARGTGGDDRTGAQMGGVSREIGTRDLGPPTCGRNIPPRSRMRPHDAGLLAKCLGCRDRAASRVQRRP